MFVMRSIPTLHRVLSAFLHRLETAQLTGSKTGPFRAFLERFPKPKLSRGRRTDIPVYFSDLHTSPTSSYFTDLEPEYEEEASEIPPGLEREFFKLTPNQPVCMAVTPSIRDIRGDPELPQSVDPQQSLDYPVSIVDIVDDGEPIIGQLTALTSEPSTEIRTAVSFSPGANYLARAWGNRVEVMSISSSTATRHLLAHHEFPDDKRFATRPIVLKWNPEGTRLLIAMGYCGYSLDAYIWDLKV